jgi:catechol 2,3-dioxygenase-like lactoylglutathione lyase family enzyme
MAGVIRLLTSVDLHPTSVSARHEAVLADGRRVVLLDDRGWSHWEALASILREQGVEIEAAELSRLPHDVELGPRLRGSFHRIAPGFPVRDVDAALAFYAKLGFTVRKYEGGDEYGFATRDGVEIHLGLVPDADRRTASAYLYVHDADAIAAEWRAAGAEVHGPEDTAWGQHEGAMVDPDGNVIRFGSPLHDASQPSER